MDVVPCPVVAAMPLCGLMVATDAFDELHVTEIVLPVCWAPLKKPGADAVNAWLPLAAMEGLAGLIWIRTGPACPRHLAALNMKNKPQRMKGNPIVPASTTNLFNSLVSRIGSCFFVKES